MQPLEKFSLTFIGFLQAFGITLYCALIGFLLWAGGEIFGPMKSFLGPFLVLALLVASVLICALLAFGYPAIMFWDKKDTTGAVKLVSYTAGWLAFSIVLGIITIIIL